MASQLQNRGKDEKKKPILQECLGDGAPRCGDVCWDGRVLGEISEIMGTQ